MRVLDGVEIIKCVQERFLQQFAEGPTRAMLDLLLAKWEGQVNEVFMDLV